MTESEREELLKLNMESALIAAIHNNKERPEGGYPVDPLVAAAVKVAKAHVEAERCADEQVLLNAMAKVYGGA